MGQLINVLLAIEKAHTVPQRALYCRLGLGGLNQVICGKYNNIFTKCTNKNQFELKAKKGIWYLIQVKKYL